MSASPSFDWVVGETPVRIDEATWECLARSGSGTGGLGGLMEALHGHVQSVSEAAPSDATSSLTVRQERDGYVAVLELRSRQRAFRAQKVARRLSSAIIAAYDEVAAQLATWRRSRGSLAPEWT